MEVRQGPAEAFCLLSVSWGLIADIDIESETMRSMGAARFTLQARETVSRRLPGLGSRRILCSGPHA